MGARHNPEWNVGLRRRPALWVVAVSALLVSIVFMRRRDGDRLRWYRVVYWLAYRLGLAVWRRPTPPADLVALVEGPSALPTGRALDLGCGTGTDAIYLATHGWDVTGVDAVPKALATARRDATAAGVAPRFVQGDVTRLHELSVGDGYALIVDFGCFHTLPEDRRPPTSPASPRPPRRERCCCCMGSGDRPRPRPCTPGSRQMRSSSALAAQDGNWTTPNACRPRRSESPYTALPTVSNYGATSCGTRPD
jgi:hypothetical protein